MIPYDWITITPSSNEFVSPIIRFGIQASQLITINDLRQTKRVGQHGATAVRHVNRQLPAAAQWRGRLLRVHEQLVILYL